MSWAATDWARKQRVGNATLKLLLVMLANYANEDGETFYSQARISFDTEIPERTLRRKLQELEGMGLIAIEQRKRDDGTRTSNLIRLLPSPTANLADGIHRPKEGGTTGQKGGSPPANMVAGQESQESQEEQNLSSAKKRRTPQRVEYSEQFEEQVWKPYPRQANTSKKNAYEKFERLSEEDQALVIRTIPHFAAAMRREGRTEDKISHLEFYISKRQFETVRIGAAPSVAPGVGPNGGATPPEQFSHTTWGNLMKIYRNTNNWKRTWGPEPGQPGCLVPKEFLEKV